MTIIGMGFLMIYVTIGDVDCAIVRESAQRVDSRAVTRSGVMMGDDDVFSRRWVLTEDELLRMLWRSHGGENPDVVLLELYANDRGKRKSQHPFGGGTSRSTRHIHRDRQRLPE